MPPCFEEVRRLAVIALAISLRQRSPWEATGGLLEVGPRDWQPLVMPSPPGPPMILGNMRSLAVRSCELCHHEAARRCPAAGRPARFTVDGA